MEKQEAAETVCEAGKKLIYSERLDLWFHDDGSPGCVALEEKRLLDPLRWGTKIVLNPECPENRIAGAHSRGWAIRAELRLGGGRGIENNLSCRQESRGRAARRARVEGVSA